MKNTIRWILGTLSLSIILKLVDHSTGYKIYHTYSNVWLHWLFVLAIALYTVFTYLVPIVISVNMEIKNEEYES